MNQRHDAALHALAVAAKAYNEAFEAWGKSIGRIPTVEVDAAYLDLAPLKARVQAAEREVLESARTMAFPEVRDAILAAVRSRPLTDFQDAHGQLRHGESLMSYVLDGMARREWRPGLRWSAEWDGLNSLSRASITAAVEKTLDERKRGYSEHQRPVATPKPQLLKGGKVPILAVSKERYRASASERRRYGGSTVTEFWVYRREDAKEPTKWHVVRGYGKTPGERKSYAIAASGLCGCGNGMSCEVCR